jgi:hypothetical protein
MLSTGITASVSFKDDIVEFSDAEASSAIVSLY